MALSFQQTRGGDGGGFAILKTSPLQFSPMMDRQKQIAARKQKMQRHLVRLTRTVQEDMGACLEKQEEMSQEDFFHLDEQFQKIESLFGAISTQIDDVSTLIETSRCAERMAFVEDRLDEMEAVLYRRPRRRRRPGPDFARLFGFTQNGGADATAEERIPSLSAAYQILGLEAESDLMSVTRAFRRFVKECHPDARGGDRSGEGDLRRALAAYQMIRAHLSDGG